MGLMYLFPTEENESERIIIDRQAKKVTLKNYGLPWIFWGYLGASLVVILSMHLAIKNPIEKLIATNDPINVFLGQMVSWTLILTPAVLLGFFFYEKIIEKTQDEIKLTYKIFFIPFLQRKIKLATPFELSVNHFMDSPNVAKMQNHPDLKGFENRGYFELYAKNKNGENILIDRHSRKADLEKIKQILQNI